ncbi:MAG TPA: acyl-CoA dehydrogenase family protein [Methylomirabilota bacterium]|jgi:alkylation response protein AidB-like acyl-CoA dehydrogenase|nr:acyl-CoA dehydrogenase family protein [Methylomirabilota bacterium]
MRFPLTAEQEAVRARARALADQEFRERAARWDEREEYPWENVKQLVEAGLMGMTIPPEYGGQGRPLLDAVLAIEQVARVCGVTGRILVDSNLGPVGAIVHHGTEAQKRKYLPRVVRGDKPAIAITEPDAGSAAADLETRAARDGDAWALTGTKRWITGAGVSQTYVVFCRFDDIPGAAGIGALIVDADAPGLAVARRERAMGMRGIPEGEIVFDRCRVPGENLLLGAGGFKRLMSAYNGQRLGAATVALGLAQGALDAAVAHAGRREQFGRPVGHFQGLRWMIADMALQVEAARQLIYRAAANAGHGLPDVVEAAMAKTIASETAIRVTNDALQVFGASGYSRDLPLERMVRDARMFTIGGGTVQMMRNVIAGAWLGRLDEPGL